MKDLFLSILKEEEEYFPVPLALVKDGETEKQNQSFDCEAYADQIHLDQMDLLHQKGLLHLLVDRVYLKYKAKYFYQSQTSPRLR